MSKSKLSNHRTSTQTSLNSWRLPFYQQLPITHTREVRMWRKLDNENVSCRAFHRSSLCDVNNQPATIEEYFDRYQSVLEQMADTFAPIKKFTQRRQHLAAWMDNECIKLRRHSRMLERLYCARKLPADCLAWIENEQKHHTVYRRKESQFWTLRLRDQAGQPRKMWKTISSILGKTETGNDSEASGLTT